MELPRQLRQAVEAALGSTAMSDLMKAADGLSSRYRDEVKDSTFHLSDNLAAQAYLATRLPATYAAVSACFKALQELNPDFAPTTLLDVGAGPGTVMWAASEHWRNLKKATLLEASTTIRHWGETLGSPLQETVWHTVNIATDFITTDFSAPKSELVSAAYVLNELEDVAQSQLLHRLWEQTTHTLVLVEPGTPAGWQRILTARTQLIEANATILAPCPHHEICPLTSPDWCHFSQRVARSRLHKHTKHAEVGWEDEKYAYLIATRHHATTSYSRVLSPPKTRSGFVQLKLCKADGSSSNNTFSKRQGEVFKEAKKLEWGEILKQKAES
ncbi:MAG: small ribosomal subunit Rsm22 family protein [Trueperaceae bacterium]